MTGTLPSLRYLIDKKADKQNIYGSILARGTGNQRYWHLNYEIASAMWGTAIVFMSTDIAIVTLQGSNNPTVNTIRNSITVTAKHVNNNHISIDLNNQYAHSGILVAGQAASAAISLEPSNSQ